MEFHLVVLRTFAGFKRGDVITDQAAVRQILTGPEAAFVVRVRTKEA